MASDNERERLKAHVEWCAEKLELTREGIGDALVCVSDKNGNISPNPAFAGYIQLAKEYRVALRQLDEMGAAKSEGKSSLASLRLITGKREVV